MKSLSTYRLINGVLTRVTYWVKDRVTGELIPAPTRNNNVPTTHHTQYVKSPFK